MATITSTGLGSGLEINTIVESLVAAEKDPIMGKIEQEAEQATAQISALGQVNNLLSSLKSSYSSLNKNSTFNSTSTSTSDSSIVEATTGFGAKTGVYEIEVQALAQQHTLITDVNNSYSSVNDVMGGGTIQIRFGSYAGANFTPGINSTNQTIAIDSNASISDIRDAINEGDYGINASILYDGSGYRLTLQNEKSGANEAMEITITDDDGNNTDGAGLSALAYDGTNNSLEQTLAAQDAIIDFNGISITRDSNTVNQIIDGVTFELNSAEVGTKVKVTVNTDTSKVEAEIRDFVENYNNVMKQISEFTAFNSPTDKGVLIGDAAVRGIESFMRGILNTRLEDVDGSIKSMADLGILTTRDGTLEINEDGSNGVAVFSDVLANNVADVAKFFAKSGNTSDSNIDYISSSTFTKEGTYNVEITQVATQGELKGNATLPADFGATPFVINESNNSFVMRIDGIKSNPITLTNGSYATESSLIAEIQSQINSDATLKDKGVSVNVAIENQELVIKSNAYGGSSTVAMLSVDDSVTGNAIAAFDFAAPPVNIAASSTFDISVDGVTGSIDIQGSYNADSDLITALEADILAKTGKTATVAIADNKLTITSDSGGAVTVSNLGATSLAELGLADTTGASDLGIGVSNGITGVGAEGTINGAAALSDGQYLLAKSASGDAQGIKIEVKGGDFNYTATSSVLDYPFTAAADSTFELSVDGTLSTTLDLTGQTFTTDNELTTAIQTLLDADVNLSGAGEAVTVAVVSGKLQFTSSNATSQLSVSAAGTGTISDLGLTVASATINSSISFSEGIASKIDEYLNAVIDKSISNNDGDVYSSNVDGAGPSSLIDAKTDSLYKKLIDIDKREESLNYKMEQYEKRLFKEFNAMDMLVAQLGSTMTALQGALDALPGYTRDKK